MLGDVKISTRAIGVVENNGKILFQKRKNDEFWALPSGAIATLEQGFESIKREIEEETGAKDIEVVRPLWFSEYFFTFDNTKWHQYLLGYLIKINKDKLTNIKDTYEFISYEDL